MISRMPSDYSAVEANTQLSCLSFCFWYRFKKHLQEPYIALASLWMSIYSILHEKEQISYLYLFFDEQMFILPQFKIWATTFFSSLLQCRSVFCFFCFLTLQGDENLSFFFLVLSVYKLKLMGFAIRLLFSTYRHIHTFIRGEDETQFALFAVSYIFSSSREEHYILHGYLELESIMVALFLEHNAGRQLYFSILLHSSDY